MRFLTVFLMTALVATPALAHGGGAAHIGFIPGLLHPFGGLDHIAAMLATGLLAARLGGRALWLVPVAFLAMMAIGAVPGLFGTTIPFVEAGIVLSILVMGGLVALGRRVPVVIAAGLAGIFAVFHGHAHGAEIPAAASALGYGAGFLTATVLLLGAGLLAGLAAGRVGSVRKARLARVAGAAF